MKVRISRFGLPVVVCLVVSLAAWGQYPGGGMGGTTGTGGTYTAPAGGYKASTGIAIGAAAAAAGGIGFLLLHNRGSVKGCVESGANGATLTSGKTVYTLVGATSDIKPGERFELKGKASQDKAGHHSFDVRQVAKDLGAC